jgi:hypothetical protein
MFLTPIPKVKLPLPKAFLVEWNTIEHYLISKTVSYYKELCKSKKPNESMRSTRSIFQRVARKSNAAAVGVRGSFFPRVSAFHSSASLTEATSKETPHQWADPLIREYRYWNRENSPEKKKYSFLIEISPESIQREARILSLSSEVDDANRALHEGPLPMGAQLLGVGQTPADFEQFSDAKPNALFVSPSCPNASVQVPAMLKAFPSIEWVHVRSAGIDFVVSAELSEYREKVEFTNAKVRIVLCFVVEYVLAVDRFHGLTPHTPISLTRLFWNVGTIQFQFGRICHDGLLLLCEGSSTLDEEQTEQSVGQLRH